MDLILLFFEKYNVHNLRVIVLPVEDILCSLNGLSAIKEIAIKYYDDVKNRVHWKVTKQS